jgi:hypothetical protein
LQSCRLAHGEATALSRIVVNVVMPVFTNVRNNGCCRSILELDAKSV